MNKLTKPITLKTEYRILNLPSELHIHLGGCIHWENLYELGKVRYLKQKEKLSWYEQTFSNEYGRSIEAQKYWLDSQGKEFLRQDYLVSNSVTFEQFQASFNLVIALFSLDPKDTSLLEVVLDEYAKKGYGYCEFRVMFPYAFSEIQIEEYLKNHLLVIERFSKKTFEPKIVFSMGHEESLFLKQWDYLIEWMKNNLELAKNIVGVDFSGFEEQTNIAEKESIFKKIHEHNKNYPDLALAILYHVGETFSKIGIKNSIRRVLEATIFGAHRLGHCVSLGVNPNIYKGTIFYESVHERIDHLNFLIKNKKILDDFYFFIDVNKLQKELEEIQICVEPIEVLVDQIFIEETLLFQEAVMNILKSKNAVIESCLTSNVRLCGLNSYEDHPIRRFLDHGLNVVVSSDDPGIFDADLLYEWDICKRLGIDISSIYAYEEFRAKNRVKTC